MGRRKRSSRLADVIDVRRAWRGFEKRTLLLSHVSFRRRLTTLSQENVKIDCSISFRILYRCKIDAAAAARTSAAAATGSQQSLTQAHLLKTPSKSQLMDFVTSLSVGLSWFADWSVLTWHLCHAFKSCLSVNQLFLRFTLLNLFMRSELVKHHWHMLYSGAYDELLSQIATRE